MESIEKRIQKIEAEILDCKDTLWKLQQEEAKLYALSDRLDRLKDMEGKYVKVTIDGVKTITGILHASQVILDRIYLTIKGGYTVDKDKGIISINSAVVIPSVPVSEESLDNNVELISEKIVMGRISHLQTSANTIYNSWS